jgi:SRSO17 transposase
MQHVLDRLHWDPNLAIDALQKWIVETLGPRGSLILDETGFLKKGKKSVGVGRQYTGTAGKVENAQVGVFAAWATDLGATLIDRELYLPKDWAENKARRREAKVPEEIEFKTKIEIGMELFDKAKKRGLNPEWVLADSVYGGSYAFRSQLEEEGHQYILGVKTNHTVTTGWQMLPIARLFSETKGVKWSRLSMGSGTKCDRKYDWAQCPLNGGPGDGYVRIALARRNIEDPTTIAYFLVFCSSSLSLQDVVRVAGTRWRIEECFESGKSEVGLDHYEVRSWHGWYKHITLSMLGLALLTVAKLEASQTVKQSAHNQKGKKFLSRPDAT